MALYRNPDGSTTRKGGQLLPSAGPRPTGNSGAGGGGGATGAPAAPTPAPYGGSMGGGGGGGPITLRSGGARQMQNQWRAGHGLPMPVAYLGGKPTYKTGIQSGPQGMTYVAPPGQNFAFSGSSNTSRTGSWSGGVSGGGSGNRGGSDGFGGGGGFGGSGGGGGYLGASGLAGQQLQEQLDKANAANQQRLDSMLGLNEQGKGELLDLIRGGYGGLQGRAEANKGEEMGFLEGQYGQIFDSFKGLSDAEYQREGRRRDAELGAASQSLVGRGLGNSTVVDSVRRGIVDDSALRESEIGDRRINREAGYRAQFAGQGSDTLSRNNAAGLNLATRGVDREVDAVDDSRRERIGLLERVTEAPPDLGLYARLLSQPGAMTGGGSLGGGGYGGGGGGDDVGGLLRDYLGALLGGGPAGQGPAGGGGGFTDRNADWVRQQTETNDRIRADEFWRQYGDRRLRERVLPPANLAGYL